MDHQDFKEVVLTKRKPTGTGTAGGTLKDQRAVANVRSILYSTYYYYFRFLSYLKEKEALRFSFFGCLSNTKHNYIQLYRRLDKD
mgnify:CR=1 FL=1|jgi:hypothetical protein